MRIQEPALGDDHVKWDPADEASVTEAKDKFDAAIKAGKRAFKMDKKKRGEPITEFDPSLSNVLIVAALAGG